MMDQQFELVPREQFATKMGRTEESEEMIPFDVVAEFILPGVQARDLVRFRLVCKSWRRLIEDPDFIHKYLSRHNSTLHQTQPSFFTSIRSNGSALPHGHQVIFFTTTYGETAEWVPQDLCGMDVKSDDTDGRFEGCIKPTKILSLKHCPRDPRFGMLPPCKGLVLFVNKREPLYLCNPVTGESTTVPPSPAAATKCCFNYGFGFDDHGKELKILHVWQGVEHSRGSSVAYEHGILSLGKGFSWRQLGPLPFCHHFRIGDPGIPSNGSLHWVVHDVLDGCVLNNAIAAFDLRREEFRRKALPPGLEEAFLPLFTLTEVDGCLALVNVICPEPDDVGLDVWVLEDYESDIWTKRHHICLGRHNLLYRRHVSQMIMLKDEILLQLMEEKSMIVYASKLKTRRKFWFESYKEFFPCRVPFPWYIYKQDPGSAFFIAALRSAAGGQ